MAEVTKAQGAKTGTERSRRLRARRAAGRMIVRVEVSSADLEMAQRLSGAPTPLTPVEVAGQMILALRSVGSTLQKKPLADNPATPRGRGTWDDPFLSIKKPLVWS